MSLETIGEHIEEAWAAFHRQEWDRSIHLWEEIRALRPDMNAGFVGGAFALRQAGKFDAAEALLDVAADRFPDEDVPVIEHAWAPVHRGDWPTGLARFRAARARFADIRAVDIGEVMALRVLHRLPEAELLAGQALERFQGDQQLLVEYAWIAHLARDWTAAIARWHVVRETAPHALEGYVYGAAALREAWHQTEAEALLSEAMQLFPDAVEPVVAHAWIAQQSNRFDDAAQRFDALRARFVNEPSGWRDGALALRLQFAFAAADEVLREAIMRFPDDAGFMLDHATLAVAAPLAQNKNWPEALRRINLLVATHPRFENGVVTGVRMFIEAGEIGQAEALAGAAVVNFPNSVAVATLYAEVAESRGATEEATIRYQAVKQRFPDQPHGDIGVARLLTLQRQFEAADRILVSTVHAFPHEASAAAAYADLASRQERWNEAHRRWEIAQAQFPNEATFPHRVYEASMRASDQDPDAALAVLRMASAPLPAKKSIDPDVRDLVMRFESLGGRGPGCEFGIFQRNCGAEPLGLLRWAEMPFDMLLFTLRNRFEGVGSEEHTELYVSAVGGGRGEYCTRDRRGMMTMHTFVYDDQMPMERMRKSALNRLRFLSQKLIDDLETGRKIFVYRMSDRNLLQDEVLELHRAVRAYGDSTLLYVRYQDAEHPNGTVEEPQPGLLIGYIDRFMASPEDQLTVASATASWSWLAICRAAYALWSHTKQSET